MILGGCLKTSGRNFTAGSIERRTMKCTCGSERILIVTSKCSDLCHITLADREHDGYVPYGLNIGGGDYLEFDMCLDCGMHIGTFPVTEDAVNEAFPE